MNRRKFIVALGGLAGLSLIPLGCGSDRVLASGVSPTPTPSPSPTPVPLTAKDGETAIEQALIEICAKFGFEPLRVGGQVIYQHYGATGGLCVDSVAYMLRRGKGSPPAGYLNGEDLGLPPSSGHLIVNAGNGWAHVGIRWTKELEYTSTVQSYIAYVKELFEEAAEALAHTV